MKNSWENKLWQKNIHKWNNRSQDLNYRNLLIWPNIEKIISKIPPCKDGLFVDLGCGDGSETLRLRELLRLKGFSGKLLGIDQQNFFIEFARKKITPNANIRLSFEESLVTKLSSVINEVKVDLLFSLFVLQDIADTNESLIAVKQSLGKNGIGIFVFVHPVFGKTMKQKNALSSIKFNTKNRNWIWAAEYPIVEEQETFYVPYFHRSLAMYKKMFKNVFSRQEYYELFPSWQLIKRCEEKKILPFCKHKNNVYYPEILYMPSSLMAVVSNK